MLTENEMLLLEDWKKWGIVRVLTKEEIQQLYDHRISANYFCSDDRVDHCCYVRREVGLSMPSITDFLKFYGGPADLAAAFKSFELEGASFIRKRIIRVVEKQIRAVTAYNHGWHWPCGLLKDDGHTMEDLPMLAMQAEAFMKEKLPEEIQFFNYFHTRKQCGVCGTEEKNTYAFFPENAFR